MPAWIWERQIRHFAQDHRVIAFDPRGQEASDKPSFGYDHTRRARDIGELLAHLDTDPAYLLSHIIHDWNEEQCLTILGHCRDAIKPDGRLLLVETVLPTGDTPHEGKVQDMVMLVIPGGQERTEAEYASLLGKARFRLSRV
jgi:pimeloyl-ACP methyl ester carboxylesterase